MAVAVITIAIIIIAVYLYLQLPQFGKAPAGARLERIQQSPNYKEGKFQNVHFTPLLTEGYSMRGVLYNFLFGKFPRTKPAATIPNIKTELKSLAPDTNVLVWFGHSSYYLQIEGKRILVDPVLSGSASPIPGTNKSFTGTDVYSADDIPEIDYLLISHDHYDHLDYKTIIALKPKVKNVICGLGVGAHLEHWGYDFSKINERDWNETILVNDDFRIHTASTRHFSGRKFARNNTLWICFIIQTSRLKLYLGGDSGYDTHFAEMGNRFGPFDLAILDNGQYNLAWQHSHMLPHEVIQAATELKAKRLLPVHSAKFKLAQHPWDEPLKQVMELNKSENLKVITPMIGEPVQLDNSAQVFKQWWKDLD